MIDEFSSDREHRIWKYLNDKQDSFWPIESWPQWAQASILKVHRKRGDNYTLFCFLVGNGLAPRTAGEWVWNNDVVNGKWCAPLHGYDDSDSKRDKDGLINRALEKKLFPIGKAIMDMTLNKVVNM